MCKCYVFCSQILHKILLMLKQLWSHSAHTLSLRPVLSFPYPLHKNLRWAVAYYLEGRCFIVAYMKKPGGASLNYHNNLLQYRYLPSD